MSEFRLSVLNGLNYMNWNIYYKGTHEVYSALILNSCRSSVNRTRSRFWCLVIPDGTRKRPGPLVSEALPSICFVYSVLCEKLHSLSRQDQGEIGQILVKQVKKFILQVCHLGIYRCLYVQQCLYLLTVTFAVVLISAIKWLHWISSGLVL